LPGQHARSDSRSLMGHASGALAWSFVNTVVSRLGTIGIGIVLARVLGPEEFGTYAVAFVALIAVLSFNELGVSLAIVRWPGDPKAIAPTVTTISLVASLLITVIGYLLAPSFASAMGDPEATDVVRLLGLSVLVSGAVATPAALLQRQFRQDLKMLIDQVNVWVGAIVSLALALAGAGAMSLAVGRLTGAIVSGVLFVRFSPEPYRVGLDRSYVKPLLHFGLPLAGASMIVFAVGYADQLVVGHMLGSTALGFYVLAFNLSSWPVSMFSQPLRSVAPAAFSRLQHNPPVMRTTMRTLIGLLLAVALPTCLFMAGAAEPLIEFIYGSAWAPAAQALQWLALLAGFRIFFELAYDYLVVLGVSRAILYLQVVGLAILLPALVLGATTAGIAGVAAVQVGVAACVVLPLYLRQFHRAGVHSGEILRRVWLPIVAAMAVGLSTAALGWLLASDFVALAMSGTLVLAATAALLYRNRAELGRLRSETQLSPTF
jgi:O-antigen/teichoic acid export membrane protein